MCILCVHIDRELMTPIEIARALKEYKEDDPHIDEVLVKLFNNADPDLVVKIAEELERLEK